VKRLQDRVAVITGGSSGIGKATAIRLAEEGAKVVIADLDPVSGEKVAAQIGGIFVKADVTSADDVANSIKLLLTLTARLISHLTMPVFRHQMMIQF
jgi:NAD(P)-dependent dehydrogenase (short-subunit alcohol dehydrogenase family)